MRTLSLLLVAVVMFSCSSDDNSKFKFDEINILGEYDMVRYESREVENLRLSGLPVTITTTHNGDTFDLTYEFRSGNRVEVDGSFRIHEKRIITGGGTEESYSIHIFDKEELTYSVESGTRTLVIDGIPYKVTQFNDRVMKLRAKVTLDIEAGGDKGEGGTLQIDRAIDFERN